MSGLRVFGALSASVVVAGAAVIAVGMSRTGSGSAHAGPAGDAFSMPVLRTVHPTYAALASSSPATSSALSSSVARSTTPARSTPTSSAAASSSRPIVTVTASRPPASTGHRTTAAPKRASAPARVVATGTALPLRYSTGTATRVLTVTAHSRGSTVATLQAWTKASGGGWRRYGTSVTAHIGAQGMSTSPSESRSATPIGSFTLTQAFGYYADPGTALPYFRTTPSDWWISQAGSLYNTHQRCSSGCRFNRGAPNEHLMYETPYYNYAVVIDYNTRNAPGGVRPGAGSAFFLHVTDGAPTAGCVAIPQSRLVPLMRWLTPSAHPRILIGTV